MSTWPSGIYAMDVMAQNPAEVKIGTWTFDIIESWGARYGMLPSLPFICEAWCLILFHSDLLNLVSTQKYGWVLLYI